MGRIETVVGVSVATV